MNIYDRVSFAILLFIVALLLPWWLPFVAAIYLFFILDNYYEIIGLGLVFDILYGTGRMLFFVTSILLYIILRYIKKYLRPYD